ncbi:PepSY-like domain-containing protein [Mucilaginibacter flavus]|uniref:PepSY-like domain-containing protein n=1 Tax=Mucilaginibacter flavus TaxID=931504 RepID=UPI0025B4F30F|nr:PepSY-like domain-containing protein [Mucilaginibacter flavus]MDN3583162.1 PepSY-like domain-containing protein [Mucilaginibacter flavus]
MKTKITFPWLLMLAAMIALASCKKESSSKSASNTTSTVNASGALAISLASGSTTDTIYIVGCYGKHQQPDSVAFSALPTAIGTYLTANYSGYTFKKAFTILDSSKAIVNYIVIIKYNNALIGLKFTAVGVFVAALEQRDGHDLGGGPGWHHGGPFDNRDGLHRDTVAISALPTAVSSYFKTTYPTDTLLHAAITPDSAYVLISKNNGLFATAVKANGTLIKRTQIDLHVGKHTAITEASLPAAITTYLTTTYPGYVFDKAFSHSVAGVVNGYDVVISSNNTKYVVVFDATGTFVKAFAVH